LQTIQGVASDQAQISNLFDDALCVLKESIDLAVQTHNPWEVARSKIEIVLIMILRPYSYDEYELNKLLDEVWEISFPIKDEYLMGYVYENRARIQMQKENYFEAGQAFGKAACHFAKQTGQESARAFDRLHDQLLEDSLTNEMRDTLASGILEVLSLQEYKEDVELSALTNMCQEILASPI
jgi:hypothetical protein